MGLQRFTASSTVLWTVVVGLVVLGTTIPPAAGEGVDRPPPPADFALDGNAAEGQRVYATNCALCHGDSGDGHGTIFMDPPPRDLRRRDNLTSRDGWDVYRVIRDGGQALDLSPKMLPWGDVLNDTELRDVATFVWDLGSESPDGSD